MASKDNEENEVNLTAKECQARIDQFVEVTKTDEAQAQAVLQEHDWNVINALNDFLAQQIPDGEAAAGSSSGLVATTKPPSILSMITWNIDGLDVKNLALASIGLAGYFVGPGTGTIDAANIFRFFASCN